MRKYNFKGFKGRARYDEARKRIIEALSRGPMNQQNLSLAIGLSKGGIYQGLKAPNKSWIGKAILDMVDEGIVFYSRSVGVKGRVTHSYQLKEHPELLNISPSPKSEVEVALEMFLSAVKTEALKQSNPEIDHLQHKVNAMHEVCNQYVHIIKRLQRRPNESLVEKFLNFKAV